MDRRLSLVVPSACVLLCCAACGGVPGETVGEAPTAVTDSNALTANALNANALNANALNANALNANALNANALSAAALAALADPGPTGDLSRQLLRYTVSCALAPWQGFALSWTDLAGITHDDAYPGLLGLSPTWAWRPLTVEQQEWVSACLASRVNWYGVPVTLSSRGRSIALWAGSDELDGYPALEGAFWGNLFGPTPYLRACHDPADDANSRAQWRDCAAGHLDDQGDVEECGMIHIVGACADVCAPPATGTTYYPSCADPALAVPGTTHVVTTYLPAAGPG